MKIFHLRQKVDSYVFFFTRRGLAQLEDMHTKQLPTVPPSLK